MKLRMMAAAVLMAGSAVCGQETVAPPVSTVPPAPAPGAEPELVSIDHHFKKGDKFSLELTTSARADNAKAQVMTFDVDVEVLDKDADDEVTIAWTQKLRPAMREMMDKFKTPSELQVATVLKISDGFRFEFTIDELGEINEVKNFDQVRERMDKVFDEIAASKRAEGMDPALVERIIKVARGVFSNEDQARTLLLKEPSAYFKAYSFELEPGAEQVSEVDLPNAFGGPDFPGKLRAQLIDYDPKAPKIMVAGLQSIDREKGREALIGLIKSMSERSGSPMPESDEDKLAKANLSIDTGMKYRYDKESGIIESATITTAVTFGESSRTETLEMKLTKPLERARQAPAAGAPTASP